MLFINYLNKNEYWEFDKEKMMVFNYYGGYHYITYEILQNSTILEYKNWHELYLMKHFCPLEVDITWKDIWVSPEGQYYNGEAHENRAEEILEIIYGEIDVAWPGDKLEELGWIRATTSFMWEIRFEDLENKQLTQKQYNALWDWCECHKKIFPKAIEIKN